MPNRVGTFNTFAGSAPPWSLPNLDANFTAITTAFNDASLGYNNYIGTDTGGANNYIVSCSIGVPATYNVGMTVTFKPANTNTGASTITVNSVGSVPIQHGDGTACIGGEIQANKNITLIYNGTAFQIQGPPFGYGTTIYYDYDDFIFTPNQNSKLFGLVTNGNGSVVAGPSVQAGHPGWIAVICGTAVGKTTGAYPGNNIFLDTLTYTVRAIVSTPAVLDTNQVFFGFNSAPATTIVASQNAIGFLASSASSFWTMETINGTSATNTATTAAVSGATWYDLMIVANAAGATFFVNGTQVGTQSATYPASTAAMVPVITYGAVSGTSRQMNVDLFEITVTGIPILSGSSNPRFAHGLV